MFLSSVPSHKKQKEKTKISRSQFLFPLLYKKKKEKEILPFSDTSDTSFSF